jgi:hypothetical protein
MPVTKSPVRSAVLHYLLESGIKDNISQVMVDQLTSVLPS